MRDATGPNPPRRAAPYPRCGGVFATSREAIGGRAPFFVGAPAILHPVPLRPETLPDPILRAAVRGLVTARRVSLAVRGPEADARLRDAMDGSPIALHTDAANDQHYMVHPELFDLMLGPRRKYSACVWGPATTDLTRAEEDTLALTCGRAGLADGMRILELGCGWGSLTVWMAQHLPSATIVAVSNSAQQRRVIERELTSRGLDNVEVVTADMNTFAPDGVFDRVVSVEMFEHMRNWSALLERVRGWLDPDGRVFLHVFCHRSHAYPFETDARGGWMARTFFTGGMMPSFDLVERVPSPFAVERRWMVSGLDYARTASAWLGNLDAHRERAIHVMGGAEDPAGARLRLARWRVFLMACEGLFATRGGREWHVAHHLLSPA